MDPLARHLERAVLALLRRPLPTVVLLALATALAIAGLGRTTFELSAVALFADGDAGVADLDRLYQHWGPDDRELLVLAEGSPASAASAVLAPDALGQLALLGRRLAEDPAVASVRSLADLPPEQLVDPTRADTWTVPGLLSADGSRTLTALTLSVDGDDLLALRGHVARIRAAVEEVEQAGPLSLTLAGIPAVRAESLDALVTDQLRLVPLALGLAMLLLAAFFRTLRGVVVPLAAALLPTLLLLGLMGWLGEPIGMLNQVYTSLLPCLAMADAIHILCRYRRLRPGIEDPHRAIARAVALSGRACVSTSLTTAFGFLSLLLAPMPILRDFGLLAAVGMLLAGLVVVVIVPLLLAAWPEPKGTPARRSRADGRGDLLDRLVHACARWAGRRRRWIFAGFGALALGSALAVTGLVFDTRLGSLLPVDSATARAQDVLDTELGGTLPLHLDLEGPPGFFRRPAVIAELDRLESALRQVEGVRSTLGPGSWLRIAAEVAGTPTQETPTPEMAVPEGTATGIGGLPTTRRRLLELLILGRNFERANGVETGARAGNAAGGVVFSDDSGRARLVLRLEDRGGRAHLSTARRIEAHLAGSLPHLLDLAGPASDPPLVQARLTGISHLAYRGSANLTRDLASSLLLAFLLVSVVLAWIAGSWRIGLLGTAQNALPLLAAAGLMALLDWPFEPTSAVVFTLGLAIAVDDTLHVLCHYREHPEAGGSGAILGSGRALVITSATLGCAFGALALASFPALRIFGTLGAVVVAVALAVDLLLVPAALQGATEAEPRLDPALSER